jgi:hypothetical protein
MPVSLPIPSGGHSRTTYGDLGLGDLVSAASRGKLGADDYCHQDPMFTGAGECLFGQCGAAQTHLVNQGVGVGDIFLFSASTVRKRAASRITVFSAISWSRK